MRCSFSRVAELLSDGTCLNAKCTWSAVVADIDEEKFKYGSAVVADIQKRNAQQCESMNCRKGELTTLKQRTRAKALYHS